MGKTTSLAKRQKKAFSGQATSSAINGEKNIFQG